MLAIFRFIFTMSTRALISLINKDNEQSYFLIDFISKKNILNRVECKVDKNRNFFVKTGSVNCKTGYYKLNSIKLDDILNNLQFSNVYSDALKDLKDESVDWNFNFPSTDINQVKCPFTKENIRKEYSSLSNILFKKFDKNITNVSPRIEAENAYIVT